MLTIKTWRWFTVRLFGLSDTSRTWTVLRKRIGDRPDEDDGVDDIDRALGVQRDE